MERGFGHSVEIDAYGELLPSEKNHVALDPTVKDKFGLPVPQITIGHDENSLRDDRAHEEDAHRHLRRGRSVETRF